LSSFLINSVAPKFLMSYSSKELLLWADLCPPAGQDVILGLKHRTVPPGLAWTSPCMKSPMYCKQ
jgi:hypothetical protein